MAGMTAPRIFDRNLIRCRLRRALAGGYEGFLLARAIGEVEDRLGAILRRFPLALDLGAATPALAERLRAIDGVKTVVHLASLRGQDNGLLVVGDEEAVPFGAATFDLVTSVLALQAVNDLPGTLAQIRRILKADGFFLACLFGGATLTELRQAFTLAEAQLEGGASPRVAPFADLRDLGALLQRAGFALPVTDVDTVVVRYADPFGLMRDLRAMGLTNALADRRRTPLRRSTLFRAAEIYAQNFADPDGRIRATFELVWLSGWAPHESQQQPLRPGSAQTRLADALGVREESAGEKVRH
jgi:SAM-dependent methyltransferase